MSELDPKNLIIEAKNGNASAFDALYRLYFTPVFRYLYARTWNREISEDIAQTVFVKAYTGLGSWSDQGKNPLAYFFTIARNALIDHWNGERHITVEDSELEKVPDTTASTPTMIDNSLSGEILKRALSTLTEDQREILTLRYFGELEYHEISLATGKSEEAVRQHHSRALKQLRGTLKGV